MRHLWEQYESYEINIEVNVPIHEYLCVCGRILAEYVKLSSSPPPTLPCPCGDTAKRQFPTVHTRLDFAKPVELMSCAPTDPDDVRNFARNNPNIKVELNEASDMYGVPIAHNETERRQVLKYFGYTDKEKRK
jgi:hypothetical protein